MPQEFPDRIILCNTVAVSVQPSTQSVGVSYMDENGTQVLLAMTGVLFQRLGREIENVLESVPDALRWGQNFMPSPRASESISASCTTNPGGRTQSPQQQGRGPDGDKSDRLVVEAVSITKHVGRGKCAIRTPQ